MMEGEGMVAVVRGLQDSGLAVTVYEGGREYTLMPNVVNQHSQAQSLDEGYSSPTPEHRARHDCGAQVTDGQYASIYKMAHCNVTPTSPAKLLTEFPPQRAELKPGCGNFEVGGAGSGEAFFVGNQTNGSFRGGMNWPDRGSVCQAQKSREPDAFARSLRSYPCVSPVRSSEIVERLISYTQAKNYSKNVQSKFSTKTNYNDYSNQTSIIDRRHQNNKCVRSTEMNVSRQVSPVRGKTRRSNGESVENWQKSTFSKTKDIRFLKEVTRRVKESMDNMSNMKPHHSSPTTRQIYEKPILDKRCSRSTNTVNMEVSEEIMSVSKEVPTNSQPTQKTVGVSPSTSVARETWEGAVLKRNPNTTEQVINNLKFAQALTPPSTISKAVETTLSYVEIPRTYSNDNVRLSKSDKDIRRNKQELQEEILQWLEDVSVCPNVHPQARILRDEVLTKLSVKLRKLSEALYKPQDLAKLRIKIGKCLKYVPIWYPENREDHQWFREKLSDELINRISNKNNLGYQIYPTTVFRADVSPLTILSVNDDFKNVIKDWFNEIPVKSRDNSGRELSKEHILNNLMNRLKFVVSYKAECDREMLKNKIIDMVNKIPLEIHESCSKYDYINQVAENLIGKLNKVHVETSDKSYTGNVEQTANLSFNKGILSTPLRNNIQPTENELKYIVNNELTNFFRRTQLEINEKYLVPVETELVDIILNCVDEIRSGNDVRVKNEINEVLNEISQLSEHDIIYFTNILIKHLKEVLSVDSTAKSQKINAFQTESRIIEASQNIPIENKQDGNNFTELSIQGCSTVDLNAYVNKLIIVIKEWLATLPIEINKENGYIETVVNDLAGDIVDRQRYLKMNPDSLGSDADEIELLKYQIFKWINKLVGEQSMEIVQRASELMERIRKIPSPIPCFESRTNRFEQTNIRSLSKSLFKSQNTSAVFLSTVGTQNSMSSQNMNYSNGNVNYERRSLNETNRKNHQGAKKTAKQAYTEYESFVDNWVKELPIKTTPEHHHLIETMRMAMYNGIFKIIAKVKFDVNSTNNFYFQDLFDDSLEELLQILPTSEEMEAKKQGLKSKLIGRTIELWQQIHASTPSYRRNIYDIIKCNAITKMIPESKPEVKTWLVEIYDIMAIADNYILYLRYKNENITKANIYKEKVIKYIGHIYDDITRREHITTSQIKKETYLNDILLSITKVPEPDEEELKYEADLVQLGLEVEHWFSDLPLAPVRDDMERLHRKRLKQLLCKKLHYIDLDTNLQDPAAKREIYLEINKILDKLPLLETGNNTIQFMVNELYNRLVNRSGDSLIVGGRRSKFDSQPVSYDEFSREAPLSSSYKEKQPFQEYVAPPSFFHHEISESNQPHHDASGLYAKDGSHGTNYDEFSNNVLASSSLNEVQGYQKYVNPPKFFSHDLSQLNRPGPSNRVHPNPNSYKAFDEHRPVSSSFQQIEPEPKWLTLYDKGAAQGQAPIEESLKSPLPLHFSPYVSRKHYSDQEAVQSPLPSHLGPYEPRNRYSDQLEAGRIQFNKNSQLSSSLNGRLGVPMHVDPHMSKPEPKWLSFYDTGEPRVKHPLQEPVKSSIPSHFNPYVSEKRYSDQLEGGRIQFNSNSQLSSSLNEKTPGQMQIDPHTSNIPDGFYNHELSARKYFHPSYKNQTGSRGVVPFDDGSHRVSDEPEPKWLTLYDSIEKPNWRFISKDKSPIQVPVKTPLPPQLEPHISRKDNSEQLQGERLDVSPLHQQVEGQLFNMHRSQNQTKNSSLFSKTNKNGPEYDNHQQSGQFNCRGGNIISHDVHEEYAHNNSNYNKYSDPRTLHNNVSVNRDTRVPVIIEPENQSIQRNLRATPKNFKNPNEYPYIAPRNTSIYDQQPVGYSTPEQMIPQISPAAPNRQTARLQFRIEDSEDEMDTDEPKIICKCSEQRRRHRRNYCYPFEQFGMGRYAFVPMRQPCPYFM